MANRDEDTIQPAADRLERGLSRFQADLSHLRRDLEAIQKPLADLLSGPESLYVQMDRLRSISTQNRQQLEAMTAVVNPIKEAVDDLVNEKKESKSSKATWLQGMWGPLVASLVSGGILVLVQYLLK